jgi:hypothetical protein
MAFGSMCVAVNPWLSIWTQPRRTIRYVLDTDSDPDGVSLAIAVFYMLTQLLYSLFDGEGPGGTNAGIIVGTLIASAIVYGVVRLYIYAAAVRWCGRLLDGKGTATEIRAAISWGRLPVVFSLALWISALLVLQFDTSAFSFTNPNGSFAPTAVAIFFACAVALLEIWAFVLQLHCLSEVQGFTIGVAFLNLALVLFLPLCGLVFLISTVFTLW